MTYYLRIKPSAEKNLRKLPKKDIARIMKVLTYLCDDPWSGKKLSGEYQGCYSLRVWPYRVIYQVYRKELMIIVVGLGHRQGVYK